MLAKSFRSSVRSVRSAATRRRAAVVALLLAVACSQPALAACNHSGSGWWSWLGLPGVLNW